MEGFWKAAAVMVLTVILGTAIGKTEKDLATVLTVITCCIILTAAVDYLRDVFAFLWKLGDLSESQQSFLAPLLQISGVALMTEIIGMLGADSGHSSLGKAMQILGNAAMLNLSLPLFETFLTLVRELLGYL